MIKILGVFLEILGWFQIMLSPTIIGVVFGLMIYNNFPNNTGFILAILISFLGLLIGIFWATRKYKTTGTISFLSRIHESPDLNKLSNDSKKLPQNS